MKTFEFYPSNTNPAWNARLPTQIMTLYGLAVVNADQAALQTATVWLLLLEAVVMPVLLLCLSHRYGHPIVFGFRRLTGGSKVGKQNAPLSGVCLLGKFASLLS